MSYDLHVVRSNRPITYQEIVGLTNAYQDLELRNGAEIKTPSGEVIAFPGDYILWKKKEFNVWFHYNGREIISCYIDVDGTRKLKEIAHFIKAKVVGEHGEEY